MFVNYLAPLVQKYRLPTPLFIYYCDLPGSPCLSKTGPIVGPSFFIFRGLTDPKDPWTRVLSLPGAKVVRRRPHLAGTRHYIRVDIEDWGGGVHPDHVLTGQNCSLKWDVRLSSALVRLGSTVLWLLLWTVHPGSPELTSSSKWTKHKLHRFAKCAIN